MMIGLTFPDQDSQLEARAHSSPLLHGPVSAKARVGGAGHCLLLELGRYHFELNLIVTRE